MLEQVTAEVTLLISQDPGAPALDSAEDTRGLRLLAEMLVGGAQSMANWWADQPGGAHASPSSRSPWTSPGSASSGSAAASAGRDLNELRRDVVDAADPRGWRWWPSTRTASGARSPSARWRTAPRGWPARSRHGGRPRRRGDDRDRATGPEWVYAMVACFRIGAVALPCTEQLRAADLRARMDAVEPAGGGGRRAQRCDRGGAPASTGPCWRCPTSACSTPTRRPRRQLRPERPRADRVHLRHLRRGRSRSATASATWPARRSRPSTGSAPARATCCWCTAASGWSKSVAQLVRRALGARRGGAAPRRRASTPTSGSSIVERERVNVLCMAPTEYRAIAKRTELRPLPALRHAVRRRRAAEPRDRRALAATASASSIHDGYGQTETGALTGMPIGDAGAAGVDGQAAARASSCGSTSGELRGRPGDRPDLLPRRPRDRPWRTGDRVREDEDGYLWFEGRADDVIISAGYRIGPFEVESALVSHPAVAEAAAVAAPDEVRGAGGARGRGAARRPRARRRAGAASCRST